MKSILIDEIIKKGRRDSEMQDPVNKRWFAAKHLPYSSLTEFWSRIKCAWRVIQNKSFAVHYWEDDDRFGKQL